MREGFDLLIVGAGPAGASCAKRAGELGLSTLVLEASAFPRPKPCAAGLTPRALELAGEAVEACLHEPVRTLRLRLGPATVVWEGARPILYTTTRLEFDSALADAAAAAGAAVEFGARVDDVREERGAVAVSAGDRMFGGKFVVVADGARSRFAALVRRREPRSFGAVYVRAFPPADDALEPYRGIVTFDPTATRRGYGWVFPKRDHLNVGVFAQRPPTGALASDLRSFLASTAPGGWRTEGPFAGRIPGSLRPRGPARGRILLVGDAAGLADAITGEGIAHALASGRIAAEAVAEALRAGGDASIVYATRVHAEVAPHLNTARRLGGVIYSLGPPGLRRLSGVKVVRWVAETFHSAGRSGSEGGTLRVEQTPGADNQQ